MSVFRTKVRLIGLSASGMGQALMWINYARTLEKTRRLKT